MVRNLDCQQRIKNGEVEGYDRDQVVGVWGREISEYEIKMSRMRKEETNIVRREKHFERDTQDLIEYVKWISGDLSMLRDRARISEKVINDLKKSGEESVDSLMETLSSNKQKQDALDKEVDGIRAVIVAREHEISCKEDDINNLKRLIELETNEKEIEIRRIKTEIDE
jgi:predicted  nucleic acid-binding Zn-ribbon protein